MTAKKPVKTEKRLIKIKLFKTWADIKDFEKEIELFNEANKGIIEVEILN